jgi:hypothetical protein
MKRLSNIRDGTFFYVDNYEKVAEYFGIVLGSCASVIANKASLVVELLNKNCQIKKIFGKEYLYDYDKELNYFTTSMLQFIYGKEFTYVLEFDLKINEVKEGEDLILIDFIYQDYDKNFHKKRVTYKYALNDKNKSKANKEYVRSQVYEVIGKYQDLKRNSQKQKAKTVLNEMKNWLVNNTQIYQDNNSENLFLNDINLALMHSNNENHIYNNTYSYSSTKAEINIESRITCRVMSNIKKISSDPNDIYTNKCQDYYSSSSRKFIQTHREENPKIKEELIDKMFEKKIKRTVSFSKNQLYL